MHVAIHAKYNRFIIYRHVNIGCDLDSLPASIHDYLNSRWEYHCKAVERDKAFMALTQEQKEAHVQSLISQLKKDSGFIMLNVEKKSE